MPISTNELIQIGEEAIAYTRKIIANAATAIENNQLEADIFNALYEKIKIQRDTSNDCAKEYNPLSFTHKENGYITLLLQYVLAHLSGVGNCHEQSLIAADYIAQKYPLINLRLTHLDKGDHVFILMAEKKGHLWRHNSTKTWDDNFVVCDPWAEIVYSGKDWRDNLHNFSTDLKTNRLEIYKPKKHKIKNIPCSSIFLTQTNAENKAIVCDSFNTKLKTLMTVLVRYHEELCAWFLADSDMHPLILEILNSQLRKCIHLITIMDFSFNNKELFQQSSTLPSLYLALTQRYWLILKQFELLFAFWPIDVIELKQQWHEDFERSIFNIFQRLSGKYQTEDFHRNGLLKLCEQHNLGDPQLENQANQTPNPDNIPSFHKRTFFTTAKNVDTLNRQTMPIPIHRSQVVI